PRPPPPRVHARGVRRVDRVPRRLRRAPRARRRDALRGPRLGAPDLPRDPRHAHAACRPRARARVDHAAPRAARPLPETRAPGPLDAARLALRVGDRRARLGHALPALTAVIARSDAQGLAASPSAAAKAHGPSSPRSISQPPTAGAATCASEVSDWLKPSTTPCSSSAAHRLTRLVSAGRSTPWPNAASVATTTSGPTRWMRPSTR